MEKKKVEITVTLFKLSMYGMFALGWLCSMYVMDYLRNP